MKKMKITALSALVVMVLTVCVGCSKNTDKDLNGTSNNNRTTTSMNGNSATTSRAGGVVDDIGDDIKNGINDIGNDMTTK